MNINSVNSVSFGKTPLMHCQTKRTGENQRQNATLYLMDNNNIEDREEIEEAYGTSAIKADFIRSAGKNNGKRYYILQNDQTKEIISCASSSRHKICEGERFEGINTVIDEIGSNYRYADSMTPLLAQIAKDAYEQNDERIIVAVHRDEIPSLKPSCFSETKDDGWVLPQKRFTTLIDRAEQRHNIEFTA